MSFRAERSAGMNVFVSPSGQPTVVSSSALGSAQIGAGRGIQGRGDQRRGLNAERTQSERRLRELQQRRFEVDCNALAVVGSSDAYMAQEAARRESELARCNEMDYNRSAAIAAASVTYSAAAAAGDAYLPRSSVVVLTQNPQPASVFVVPVAVVSSQPAIAVLTPGSQAARVAHAAHLGLPVSQVQNIAYPAPAPSGSLVISGRGHATFVPGAPQGVYVPGRPPAHPIADAFASQHRPDRRDR